MIKKKDFLRMPIDDKILLVMSDGLWYSIHKLCRLTKEPDQLVYESLQKNIDSGYIIQSETGAKSYRMPIDSMKKWYEKNKYTFGEKIADFLVPARVYNDKTEIELFEEAPRREISIVHFECSTKKAEQIIKKLQYIARVSEIKPNVYRAYCASGDYVKDIIEQEIKTDPYCKIRVRYGVYRREIVDFDKNALIPFLEFYQNYSKYLARSAKETIQLFLPDESDRTSQMTFWTIEAIEKYDEKATVPFSGYFDTVMKRWPYNLPSEALGEDLAFFQRKKSKAIQEIKKEKGDHYLPNFSEIAKKMNMNHKDFNIYEEKDTIWRKLKNAEPLIWEDSPHNDEKAAEKNIGSGYNVVAQQVKDPNLSYKFSLALIESALETNDYDSPTIILSQIDSSIIDYSLLNNLDQNFIKVFSSFLIRK